MDNQTAEGKNVAMESSPIEAFISERRDVVRTSAIQALSEADAATLVDVVHRQVGVLRSYGYEAEGSELARIEADLRAGAHESVVRPRILAVLGQLVDLGGSAPVKAG